MALEPRVITLKYVPRKWFLAFHARRHKKAVLLAHRRAGKTVAAVNDLVAKALKFANPLLKRPNYAYVCPELKQAKLVAWEYLKESVREIPGCKISESELYVKLPNEARIRLYGADNPDSLRGMYFDGVVLDEFGDMKSSIMQVILPALSDREGFIVFMGTPKGKNDFYDKAKEAKENKHNDWFFAALKVSETKLLSDAVLRDARLDLGDELYDQEYECSFEAANIGTYFGKQMIELEKQGAFRPNLQLDPLEKVSLSMDIGYADATAIWFWQIINGIVYFFDYWEETSYDAEEVLEVLQLKPYNYDTWFLPHDAVNKTFATKKSVLNTFRDADAPCRVVARLDLFDGIDATRKTLRTYPIVFDSIRCARGIEALRNYSRKWDMDRKVFSDTPTHDRWSHGADAFRYACLSIKPEDLSRSIERANRNKQVLKNSNNANNPLNRLPLNIANEGYAASLTLDGLFEARTKELNQVRLNGTARI